MPKRPVSGTRNHAAEGPGETLGRGPSVNLITETTLKTRTTERRLPHAPVCQRHGADLGAVAVAAPCLEDNTF